MQVPVMMDGDVCGRLWTQQQGLYTVFRCQVKTGEVCRLYAQFSGGETALGIPAPENGQMTLCISVPTGRLPRGELQQGVLRPVNDGWRSYPGGRVGPFTLPPGCVQGQAYRFPWKPGEKLPCDALLCFYRYIRENERAWLEVRLDGQGRPVE